MSKLNPELPAGYQPKGRWYYRVRAEGKKRVWIKITLIRDGLPAFYRKLGELQADEIAPDRIPALVAMWQDEVQPERADKTQELDAWVMGAIADAFVEFRAGQVTTPQCIAFLKTYRDRPRTHNLMRSGLFELMRFAETKERDGVPFRAPNSNPVTSVKRMATPARKRYITDSELRRIKFHAVVGRKDRWGNRTFARSGPMIAALIEMAYLTGQRIGDLLDLRWDKRAATQGGVVMAPYIAKEGIFFEPSKTSEATGAKVLVTWTPRLRAVVARIESIGRRNMLFVFTNQDAQQLLYSTFYSAWWRTVDRAGMKGLHFHDIRAKAITDTDENQGRQAANRKGAHTTEKQTADYIRNRKAQKTGATR